MRRLLPVIALVLGIGTAHAQVTNWTFLRDDGTFSGVNVIGGTGSLLGSTTNKWFSNDSPPTNELRWGDRVFVGDAATHYTNTNACPTGDWFTSFENTLAPNGPCAYIGAFQSVIETNTVNGNASGGLLSAAQNKLVNGTAIALMGFALNNNASFAGGGFAGYLECNQIANNSSGCFGLEIDVGNFISSAYAGAPDPFQQSALVGLQVACGSGLTSPTRFPCGSGIQIVPNDKPFKVGINFLNGGVTTQTLFGATLSPAIVLPTNYAIVWYSAAGTPQGGITADGSGNVLIGTTGGGVLKVNGVAVTVP